LWGTLSTAMWGTFGTEAQCPSVPSGKEQVTCLQVQLSQGCLACKTRSVRFPVEVSWVELAINFTSANIDPNLNMDKTKHFWPCQCNDPSAQLHEQLNGWVYSNICVYITNIAYDTSSVWLKSLKIITWLKANHINWWAISLAELKFRVL